MSLASRIDKEYIEAYKARQTARVETLRLLKTALKNRLVELSRPRGELGDDEVMDVIIKQAKQRKDSIEQYNAANRPDLAAKEETELEILRAYLPQTLSGEELASVIEEAIAAVGAREPRDMGKVMSHIMAARKGRVDGKTLSAAVKARLEALKN